MERLGAVQAARWLHKLVRILFQPRLRLGRSRSHLSLDRLHLLWLLEEQAVAVRCATCDDMHVAAALTRPRVCAASAGA